MILALVKHIKTQIEYQNCCKSFAHILNQLSYILFSCIGKMFLAKDTFYNFWSMFVFKDSYYKNAELTAFNLFSFHFAA